MEQRLALRLENVSKSFGPVRALKGVDFEVGEREIHGLLGENGAGKTTLMNVLYGLYRPDSGKISIRGEQVTIRSPKDAIAHGIGMVHQHFLQVEVFTVTENIVLGTELKNRPTVQMTAARQRIGELSQRFGLEIDPDAHISDLSMGARQRVEILKTLYRGADILILDEPTTNLTPQEVDSLFVSLKKMVAEGMSVVFITHKLREVMAVCDRVSVLRHGQRALTQPRSELSEELIIKSMVGSDEMDGMMAESLIFAGAGSEMKGEALDERPVLQMSQVSAMAETGVRALDDVSLVIRTGEILGLAGVAGNGQQELAEAILAITPSSAGEITLAGERLTGLETRRILEKGVAYVPEDRLHDGFLPTATVAQNLILGSQYRQPYSKKGFLQWPVIYEAARRLIREYHIQTSGPQDTAANLSGGNIQRMMLARAFSNPLKLLILHNPTSGLDISSVESVYKRLLAYKREGVAILLISDDLDELMLMSDRIATIYRGQIVGELARSQFDKYELGRMMSGVNYHG
jgi:simple sugar transport system ATP-binding protein